jgi:hypothetical protein
VVIRFGFACETFRFMVNGDTRTTTSSSFLMTGSTVANIAPLPQSTEDKQSREKARREQFANYFAGEAASHGLIKFKTPIKRATIWLGAVLWSLIIPISLYQGYKIMQDGASQASYLEMVVSVGGLIISGAVIIAVGRWDRLWDQVFYNFRRYFLWLILAPLTLITAWGTGRYFASETLRNGIGLAAVALVILGTLFRRKPPPPKEEVEREMDASFREDVARHLDQVVAGILESRPLAMPSAQGPLLITGFPDLERVPELQLRARLGHDNRPRITPQGFAALYLGNDSLLCFEGAIDLITGALVYKRTRQVRYSAIVGVELESIGTPFRCESAQPKSTTNRRLQFGGMRPADRYRDVFSIKLSGGMSIDVNVRDSSKFKAPDATVYPLSAWQDLQHAWTAVMKASSPI